MSAWLHALVRVASAMHSTRPRKLTASLRTIASTRACQHASTQGHIFRVSNEKCVPGCWQTLDTAAGNYPPPLLARQGCLPAAVTCQHPGHTSILLMLANLRVCWHAAAGSRLHLVFVCQHVWHCGSQGHCGPVCWHAGMHCCWQLFEDWLSDSQTPSKANAITY